MYHEYGSPTEKEMERYYIDKHSATAPLYACLYNPCQYRSKRESNTKQHMESAHGWEYVRNKKMRKRGPFSSFPLLEVLVDGPRPRLPVVTLSFQRSLEDAVRAYKQHINGRVPLISWKGGDWTQDYDGLKLVW
jgi:hypothetical protein